MNKKLYLITNRKLIRHRDLYSVIEAAISGGIDTVILREKDLSYDQITEMGKRLKKITHRFNVPLIVNGNYDAACVLNADGFHTGYLNFLRNAKNYAAFNGIKGVSVHSITEAVTAEKLGADYILAGNIFETDCKKGLPGKGIPYLEEMSEKVSIPVIAIGGINETNIDKILETKASGAAVMSFIMSADDPYNAACSLKKHLTK